MIILQVVVLVDPKDGEEYSALFKDIYSKWQTDDYNTAVTTGADKYHSVQSSRYTKNYQTTADPFI